MYLEHFGLKQHPFRIIPNQEFFYSGANRGAILDALAYAIASGEGIVKIVGEVGTGKTMLCRALESRLADNIDILFLPIPSLPPEEVIRAISDELGLIHTAEQKSTQIIREMQNRLIEKHAEGRQVVLFIDEAQAMPLDSLEEIRLLSNLETSSSKLLQIVLFGQPELDQHINQPQIRQLKERITHSFYLHPFSKKEIADYLAYRLGAAGYTGAPAFSPSAVSLIYRASLGLVRRINILADKALLAGFADNVHSISAKQVKAAIHDSNYKRPSSPSYAKSALALLLALGVLWAGRAWLPLSPTQPAKPPAVMQPAQPLPAPAQAVPPPALLAENTPHSEQPDKSPAPAPPTTVAPVQPVADNRPPQPVAAPPTAPAKEHAALSGTPPNAHLPPPAQPEPTAPARAEAPPVPQGPLQSRLDASREAINKQNGANLTIQLMAVHPDAVENELERLQRLAQVGPEQLFIYSAMSNKRILITIALGVYASATEARTALAQLPAMYRQSQPVLRTFKSIGEGIRKTGE